MTTSDAPAQNEMLFENPFQMDDLMVFDDSTIHTMLTRGEFGLTVESLAHSLHGLQGPLLKRIKGTIELRRLEHA